MKRKRYEMKITKKNRNRVKRTRWRRKPNRITSVQSEARLKGR